MVRRGWCEWPARSAGEPGRSDRSRRWDVRQPIPKDMKMRRNMWSQGTSARKEGFGRRDEISSALHVGTAVVAASAVAVEDPAVAVPDRKAVGGASGSEDPNREVAAGGVEEPPENKECVRRGEANDRREGPIEEPVLLHKHVDSWRDSRVPIRIEGVASVGSLAKGAEDGGVGGWIGPVGDQGGPKPGTAACSDSSCRRCTG